MDKLSAQLEYHRISSKYGKRRPSKKDYSNPLDEMYNDDTFDSREAYADYDSSHEESRYRDSKPPRDIADNSNVTSNITDSTNNTNNPFGFSDDFASLKPTSAGPSPAISSLSSDPSRPNSNSSSISSFSSSANTNQPSFNKNFLDNGGNVFGSTAAAQPKFEPLQEFPQPSQSGPGSFPSLFDDQNHSANRYSFDEHGFDYSNGTGLVSGSKGTNTERAAGTRHRAATYAGSNPYRPTTRRFQENDRYSDSNSEADRLDEFGVPSDVNWNQSTRSRGSNFSVLSAPVNEAAKAVRNGLSNLTTGSGKRGSAVGSKSHMDYNDDFDDFDGRRNTNAYSDERNSARNQKATRYRDASDDEDEDNYPDQYDSYEGNPKAPASSGLWSKVKLTPKSRDRRNTVDNSASGPNNDTFRRPRFLSSNTNSKNKIASYDYEQTNSKYHDQGDDWTNDRYSRSRDSLTDNGTNKIRERSTSNTSLSTLKALRPFMLGGKKDPAKDGLTSTAIEEHHENYGFDDSDIVGIPGNDLSYRYKQGFGSSSWIYVFCKKEFSHSSAFLTSHFSSFISHFFLFHVCLVDISVHLFDICWYVVLWFLWFYMFNQLYYIYINGKKKILNKPKSIY